MIATRNRNLIQIIILGCVVGTSLLITPNFSSEPVDVPKLAMLVPLAFMAFGSLSGNFKILFSKEFRFPAILLSLLLAYFTLVLFVSDAPFNQQFFGTLGRNTGYLAYAALIFLAFASMVSMDDRMLRRINFSLLGTGFCTVIYGVLQLTHNDPIKWNNPYNPIIGFLGNPDFASAFLGITFVVGVGIILNNKVGVKMRVSAGFLNVFSLLLIVKSHAQQGLIVAGIGSTLVIFVYLLKTKNTPNVLAGLFGLFSLIAGTFVILGIFKLGPLSERLYKLSVRQRGYYWHAALRMMNDNPFFGVGLDSYGDNYFKYRSANAAFHTPQTQSNAAHNVFFDIGSSGGYILFFLYLVLICYTFYSAINVISKTDGFPAFFVSIFAAWLGYQSQSIVSINQLGLAVWGWALSGIIIGYGIFISKNVEDKAQSGTSRKSKIQTNKMGLMVPTISLVAGGLLALPPFIADHHYRVAMESRDANLVIQSAQSYPEDIGRSLSVAQLLANSKLFPQALKVAQRVTDIDSKSYSAWVFISQISNSNSEIHRNAVVQMKKLNPNELNLGK